MVNIIQHLKNSLKAFGLAGNPDFNQNNISSKKPSKALRQDENLSTERNKTSLSHNSLLSYKYVDRPVEGNTLLLEITFHDTCNFVPKCSRSVSHFRTCGFHFSHLFLVVSHGLTTKKR